MIARCDLDFISVDLWPLAYRFTDDRYNRLPAASLATIRPLGDASALRLAEAHQLDRLVAPTPVDDRSPRWLWHDVDHDDPARTRSWLISLRPHADDDVFVEWSFRGGCAAVAGWKTLCTYFDDFWYPFETVLISDDSRSWQILFHRNATVRFRRTTREDWNILLPVGSPLPGSAATDPLKYEQMKSWGASIADVLTALRRDGASHLESIGTLRRLFGATFGEACSLVLGYDPGGKSS